MSKGVFSWFLLLWLCHGTLSNPSCPELKSGMTNVHLVCHTHDDVGWLKTVDQYYYGSRKSITWVGVQYILDSVIPALLRDPSRKFIYVESAFFWRWWNEQSQPMREDVRKLVESGQLEFIGGGWSMNDEAAAHYNAIIDQMTLGLSWLNETLGPKAVPRIVWQIDPFGHSREQASLFAQMGMDGLFFGRLDHDDKSKRWKTQEMEMIWKGSSSLGESSWLFTGVLPHNYSPPKGFCFDLLCADDPIMDDPRLEDYNLDKMVDKFLAAVADQKKAYTTSNIIMTMGEDFDYVYAESWYKNLDKLIKYVNERQSTGSKVNVVYSTPSCYLDALHDADLKWPTKTDDFFPYSSDPHAYWTGYFTSRPTYKGYVRQCNNLLQSIKQISALSGIERGPAIDTLARAMGVAQHHDAITGTAKQHVTDDYSLRLSQGVDAAASLLDEGFRVMTQSRNALPGVNDFQLCPLMNISACPLTEMSKSFVVNVYNPLARSRSSYVRIPVMSALKYSVSDDAGNNLETQLIPIPDRVLTIPGRKSSAKYELVFKAEDLLPLSAKQFMVKSDGTKQQPRRPRSKKLSRQTDPVLKNEKLSITLDSHSKKLKSLKITNLNNEMKEYEVDQDWFWYAGMAGNNSKPEWRASGAYIFRPNGNAHEFADNVKLKADYEGPLVSEFQLEWGPWVSQVIRLYKDKNYVEVEWLVGPIDVSDGIGKEIISRVHFKDMITNSTFYTDANGREMLKRVKDKRETWNLVSSEPVSQNYYPVTSRLILDSTNNKGNAAILNDRAQGGTSLSDGQIELMVHRRLLYDDAFGVGEALNEVAYHHGLVARGHHFLIHSDLATADCDFGCQHRTLGEEILLQPILTFSSASSFSNGHGAKVSPMTAPLPANMRLLTLEPWGKGEWLLRLENFYEAGESATSGTSVVDIQNLFTDWTISELREVTLGANQLKADNVRLKWETKPDNDAINKSHDVTHEEGESSEKYSFTPMQIRSFIVKASKKQQH